MVEAGVQIGDSASDNFQTILLMSKLSFKKGLVLLSSVSLVTVFLLYRTGSFDKPDMVELPLVQANPAENDTIKPKDTVVPLRLSSSKVIILSDYHKQERDSIARKRKISKPLQPQKPVMFSGSKSGRVFQPGTFVIPDIDSLKVGFDSIHAPKKKQ
jgi:hypothetical protein